MLTLVPTTHAATAEEQVIIKRRHLLKTGALALLGPLPPWALAADNEQSIVLGFAGGLGAKLQTNISFSSRDGALQAIEEANQRNIVIGGKPTRFSLRLADDQSEPNFARITANSLVAAKVAAVIGHDTTDTSVAALPIYAEAGIPMITPTSTGRVITASGYTNVFQMPGHTDITTGHLAEATASIVRARRIAVLENGTQLGAALADGFIQNLKSLGVELVTRDSVTPKTSDFNAPLSRLKSSDPELLFFTGVGPQISAFLQNFQRLDLRCKLLVTGGGVNVEFPRAGPYPDGSYLLIHGLPPEKRPGYAEFEKAYRSRFETAISAYTMFAYDAVGMTIEAIRRLDSANPKLLIAELHKMKYKGISGNISFTSDGSQANPPYTLYQVSQQYWRPIKTYGG
ncbi:branched-chain amino acid ABC transporter substrate-binding protein [Herbaspirillum chlorophenolicum]|uniref:branched-chain amino acid ABC transporter substrate-binding protein n=1 Tax=Herbaspirillum chlorophenolicum TaxID=211589 RepID=UPI0018CEF417|nr:branched-chain amino acid ABC transporter substrate-binding protein [Herbaspirillum chlorophenolicum]